MSNTSSQNNSSTTCAHCGKGEEAGDKLKSCAACKVVKYCSRECQIAHRPQHKKACKKKAGARRNLGVHEGQARNFDRALRHFMIAVRDGDSDSLEIIKRYSLNGYATKDDYANALRDYQAYVDEIKSEQRDEAAAFREDYKYYESAV